jgi:predicted RNA-binding protein with PUA-like domain
LDGTATRYHAPRNGHADLLENGNDMQYWLFKSEPESFSIDRLALEGRTEWSGVRNYQARNFMKSMQIGDLGFFYHSNTVPLGIAGICRVVREAYPDFTALDPKSEYFDARSTREKPIWEMVDVAFERSFKQILPLEMLKGQAKLAAMPLVQKGQRLSVQPVAKPEWDAILTLACC